MAMPFFNLCATIHILHCSKIKVNLQNSNYENSEVIKDDGEAIRGYKIKTLRGLLDDSGIIEEIVFNSIKPHDLEIYRDMLLNSKYLKPNDILINDKGFISREVINELKAKRQVIPIKKRKTQEIQLVKNLGMMWESNDSINDVDISACVVHDTKDNEYYVFLTIDTIKTAKQIISTYELRLEIDEDYRQIKDF